MAIGLAVAFLGMALYANALYRSALQGDCVELPPVDLTMDELIAFRKRVLAYQVDPSAGAALVLSGAEIGALYGEGKSLTLRIDMLEDRAWINLTLPTEGGCWNVRYVGRVVVDQGLVTLFPDDLEIGDADLGPFVRARSWTLSLERIPDDHLRKVVANTRTLWVEGGLVYLRLSNRWDVW